MKLSKLIEFLIFITPERWKLPVEFNLLKITNQLEPELLDLSNIIGKPRLAIDVGANRGLYTYALSFISTKVEAFEPQPWCSDVISKYSAGIKNSNITIHKCGLSSSVSSSQLYIPILRGRLRTTLITGLASFEKPDTDHQSIDIAVKTIDEFDFQDVDFIKIDVEGHESYVIEGAKDTILKYRPVLVVEIEERHLPDLPIEEVFKKIIRLGYSGFFLQDQKMIPIYLFDVKLHQNLSQFNKNYVNNFIFKPKGKV